MPTMYEDRIYFGSEDHNLYCVGLDGKLIWKFRAQGKLWYRATAWDCKLYFTGWDCHLYCVDVDTRKLVWKFRAQGEPAPLPPAFESFELAVRKSAENRDIEETGGRKRYELAVTEEGSTSAYRQRTTYAMSSQYAAKGKYQKDSSVEEF